MIRLMEFKSFEDDRGVLLPIELGSGDLPFVPVRTFLIAGVSPGATRAGHASSCDEILVCAGGAMTIVLDTGAEETSFRLARVGAGVYVPSGTWVIARDFTTAAVLLVLASDSHAGTKQIEDHAQFLEFTRAGKSWW